MKARILVLLLCLPPLSQAAIYRWVDESGKVHFSDKQPENNATAQDISGQLRPLNNDSSTTETPVRRRAGKPKIQICLCRRKTVAEFSGH